MAEPEAVEAPRSRFAEAIWASLPSVLSVGLSLLVCLLMIAITKGSLSIAGSAYLEMLRGGLGDFEAFGEAGVWTLLTRPWGEAATKAAILTFTGLSVAVAYRAGLFNIGAQGQMTVGAIAAAALGAKLSLPFGVHAAVCVLGAAAAGGAYGIIPAVLKLRRGVHEVISTIMLNWVAISLVENWLVVGPLRAAATGDNSISGTDQIAATAALPRLLSDGSRLHAGFPLALLAAFAAWIWLFRTRLGFETRAMGQNAEAARAAGIPSARRSLQAMVLAGALAGVAGSLLVQGTELRFPATLGAPYGFDGIAIALIGQTHPLGVGASALLFGILRAGGTRMQLLHVHKSFPELIQGLALLFVAGRLIWQWALTRRAKRAPAASGPPAPAAPAPPAPAAAVPSGGGA
ncbi:MAG TPA: ABC transporter permease [Myxococcaceae bacterium]|jgi:simple sugar transport system permease protein